jgi:hypothetical protein
MIFPTGRHHGQDVVLATPSATLLSTQGQPLHQHAMGDTALACFGRIPWIDCQGVRLARRRQSNNVDNDGNDSNSDGSNADDKDGSNDGNIDKDGVDGNGSGNNNCSGSVSVAAVVALARQHSGSGDGSDSATATAARQSPRQRLARQQR